MEYFIYGCTENKEKVPIELAASRVDAAIQEKIYRNLVKKKMLYTAKKERIVSIYHRLYRNNETQKED